MIARAKTSKGRSVARTYRSSPDARDTLSVSNIVGCSIHPATATFLNANGDRIATLSRRASSPNSAYRAFTGRSPLGRKVGVLYGPSPAQRRGQSQRVKGHDGFGLRPLKRTIDIPFLFSVRVSPAKRADSAIPWRWCLLM